MNRSKFSRIKVFILALLMLVSNGLIQSEFHLSCALESENSVYADQVYINGKIVTVNDDFDVVQAIAVQGERILDVGTNDDMMDLAGPDTDIIDLEGHTVIPGLIDNHVHYLRSSPYWKHEVFFDGVNSREEAVGLIYDKIDEVEDGEWILSVGGWSLDQFTDSDRAFTKRELDRIAPDNPVFIMTGFDGGVGNSLAIEEVGPSTEGVDPYTGIIRPYASQGSYAGMPDSVRLALPSYSSTSWKNECLAKMNEDYNKAGITTVWNAGAIHYDNDFTQWAEDYVDDNGNWSNVRIFHHIKSDVSSPREAMERIQDIENWEPIPQGDYFRLQGFGEIPYIPTYDMLSSGWNPDEYDLSIYEDILEAVAEKGWPLAEHAMVTEKYDDLLDIWEDLDEEYDLSDLRWSIHHGYGMTEDQIERAADMGIFLALQNSPALTGSSVQRNFRYDSPPMKTAEDSGARWGLGTDSKIVSPYPAFFNLYFAVTGKDVAGDRVLINENVSRKDALRAYTINNAWYLFMEDDLGSIEPGKYADFVVLSNDYLTVHEDDIKDIQSILTIVGGRVGYDSGYLNVDFDAAVSPPPTIMEDNLSFIAWSDQHIEDDTDMTDLKDIVYDMNAFSGTPYPESIGGEVSDIEFVFSTGDVTAYPTTTAISKYDRLIGLMDFDAYEVLGNHDLIYGHSNPTVQWYLDKYGDYTYSFDRKGVHFISLYSEFDKDLGHSQPLTQDALDDLRQELRAIGEDKPFVLATHMSYLYVSNRDELFDVIDGYNMILWMGGHGHEASADIRSGYNCIELPSPASRHTEFTAVSITDNHLTVVPWNYERDAWSTDTDEILDVDIEADVE